MAIDLAFPNPLARIFSTHEYSHSQLIKHQNQTISIALKHDTTEPKLSALVPEYSVSPKGRGDVSRLKFPDRFIVMDHDEDKGTLVEATGTIQIPRDDDDELLLSTTARFGMEHAPFYVFSQGDLIVIFRSSIPADHEDNLRYDVSTGKILLEPTGVEGTVVVSNNVLVDVFKLFDNSVSNVTEDTVLGPTRMLRFANNLSHGLFSVLALPPIAFPHWHIFHIDSTSGSNGSTEGLHVRAFHVTGNVFSKDTPASVQSLVIQDRTAAGRITSTAYPEDIDAELAEGEEARVLIAFSSIPKDQDESSPDLGFSKPFQLSVVDVPVSSDGSISFVDSEVKLTDALENIDLDATSKRHATELVMLEKEQIGLYCYLHGKSDDTQKDVNAEIASVEEQMLGLRNRLQKQYSSGVELPVVSRTGTGREIRAGLLGFAPPGSGVIFNRTASGTIRIRCRGNYHEYLDLSLYRSSAPATWKLFSEDGVGAVTLTSIPRGEVANNIKITVSDSGLGEGYCTLSIASSELNFVETWNNLPRQAQHLSDAINGDAATTTIGLVEEGRVDDENSALYIVKLQEEGATAMSSGSVVSIHGIAFTVSRDFAEGGKTLWVSTASGSPFEQGFSKGEPITTGGYDYKQYERQPTGAQSWNERKSNLVSGSSNIDKKVSNIEDAVRETESKSPCWKPAVESGNAVRTGVREDVRHFLSLSPSMTFEFMFQAGENAFEVDAFEFGTGTWTSTLTTKATPPSSDTAIKVQNTDLLKPSFSIPPASELGIGGAQDFTVQVWVKIQPGGGDKAILAETTHRPNESLHLVVRDSQLYMGFYADDLRAQTLLQLSRWYHATFRYTHETREQHIFLNGVSDGSRTATEHWKPVDGAQLIIGRYGSSFMQGSLSDLRIYNRAKSDEEILTEYERLIFPKEAVVPSSEVGLIARYEFDEMEFKEQTTTDALLLPEGTDTNVIKRERGPINGCWIEISNGADKAEVVDTVVCARSHTDNVDEQVKRHVAVVLGNRRDLNSLKIYVDGIDVNTNVTLAGDAQDFSPFSGVNMYMKLGNVRKGVNVEEVRVWAKDLSREEALRRMFKQFETSSDVELSDKQACQLFLPRYI